jgi:hypothetical protein
MIGNVHGTVSWLDDFFGLNVEILQLFGGSYRKSNYPRDL